MACPARCPSIVMLSRAATRPHGCSCALATCLPCQPRFAQLHSWLHRWLNQAFRKAQMLATVAWSSVPLCVPPKCACSTSQARRPMHGAHSCSILALGSAQCLLLLYLKCTGNAMQPREGQQEGQPAGADLWQGGRSEACNRSECCASQGQAGTSGAHLRKNEQGRQVACRWKEQWSIKKLIQARDGALRSSRAP